MLVSHDLVDKLNSQKLDLVYLGTCNKNKKMQKMDLIINGEINGEKSLADSGNKKNKL